MTEQEKTCDPDYNLRLFFNPNRRRFFCRIEVVKQKSVQPLPLSFCKIRPAAASGVFFCTSSTHLNAGVPVLSELVVGEVVRQAELGSDPLQVLGERRAAQQVDLTVGEA